ncbi:MAG: glycosyltransferase [Bacteroidales bacterium]
MIEIKISTLFLIISYILIISAGIQIIYYLFFYLRICFVKRKQPHVSTVPISVIICAQNEEDNLRKHLSAIITQKYPEFEIVVIDDCSEDDTEFYVRKLAQDHAHITYRKIVKDPKFRHNKKLAITLGIKAATYNHFVFTDADCYPTSDEWLQKISNEFTPRTHIILGYGGYKPTRGFLDKLVRYDTFSIALQYLSFAHAGIPYMGVGRNMAYTRHIYEQSSKFRHHYHIRSGDDDLFIREMAHRQNTNICLNKKSFTLSEQVQTFKEWRSQKKRHLHTAVKYSFLHKILLLLEPLSRLLFYICLPVFFTYNITQFYYTAISCIALRFIFFLVINNCAMNRLKEKKLLVYSLLFDFVLPIIILVLHIQNKIYSLSKK